MKRISTESYSVKRTLRKSKQVSVKCKELVLLKESSKLLKANAHTATSSKTDNFKDSHFKDIEVLRKSGVDKLKHQRDGPFSGDLIITLCFLVQGHLILGVNPWTQIIRW